MRDYIKEMEEMGDSAIIIDGYDDCIVGIGTAFGRGYFFIYSEPLIIQKLIKEDGMSIEEAIEFYEYNILGSYIGEEMPVFVIE